MKSLSFFKGLSWLIVLNLLVKPVWIFFIDRQVQNIVGHELYGKYFALLNLSYVLYFLSDAGLSSMLNQRMASSKRINTKLFIGIKLFLILLFAITTIFAGWLSDISRWTFLFYIIAIQSLTSIFIFLRSFITAHQDFRADAWFSVADKFLMTIFCGAIIYTAAFGKIDIILFLQLQTLCTFLAVVAAVIYISYKKMLRLSGKEDPEQLLASMLPFALIILLMTAQIRLDAFLLERIHINGAYEAGIYATAFRLLDAGNMVGFLSASFLVPFVAKNFRDTALVSTVMNKTRDALLFMAIGVSGFALFFSPWIQQLLYHTSDPYNSLVIAICLASLPALYMVHVYSSALTATARFEVLMPILIFSFLINLVLNIILIPDYGAQGCCIAAVAGQYFCGIACYIATTKKLSINPGFSSFGLFLLLAMLLSAWFYFGKMAIHNVWVILAIAILIVLIILTLQLGSFKKYFSSLH